MSFKNLDPILIGAVMLGRNTYRQRTPNMSAGGEDYNGQKVNYDASTGDVIRIGDISYDVLDTYPNGVRLERQTEFGPDVTERSYKELLELGAIYSLER
jgi:hypothetical protein